MEEGYLGKTREENTIKANYTGEKLEKVKTGDELQSELKGGDSQRTQYENARIKVKSEEEKLQKTDTRIGENDGIYDNVFEFVERFFPLKFRLKRLRSRVSADKNGLEEIDEDLSRTIKKNQNRYFRLQDIYIDAQTSFRAYDELVKTLNAKYDEKAEELREARADPIRDKENGTSRGIYTELTKIEMDRSEAEDQLAKIASAIIVAKGRLKGTYENLGEYRAKQRKIRKVANEVTVREAELTNVLETDFSQRSNLSTLESIIRAKESSTKTKQVTNRVKSTIGRAADILLSSDYSIDDGQEEDQDMYERRIREGLEEDKLIDEARKIIEEPLF